MIPLSAFRYTQYADKVEVEVRLLVTVDVGYTDTTDRLKKIPELTGALMLWDTIYGQLHRDLTEFSSTILNFDVVHIEEYKKALQELESIKAKLDKDCVASALYRMYKA